MKILSFLTLLLFSTLAYTQLSVNNGFTAQQLGNNLAGNNVNVFNANISGSPQQYGIFQYIGNDLGLNSGVILSTGSIFDAIGPNSDGGTSTGFNNPGDSDLSSLAGFNTNDAVVFEFDFEVQGPDIEFNFVFMSEEYNEFVNSGFNDVFAFYISGPGIVGQENLAIVPGTTTPVTINTINNDSFWQFYNDNDNGAVNIEFDGFTTLMTASKNDLIPCEIYTLSLRIADGSDDIYDSGVLLQENSLIQSNISASSATFSANNTALEGCIDASFTFQLDSVLPYNITIPIGIGGTATNGVDYAQIDSIITIPAGQTSATIIIDAIAEGITEGQEVVELYYIPEACQEPDTVYLYIDDYNPLEYTITPTDVTCNGNSDGQVDLAVIGGIPPYYLTLTDSITGDVVTYNSFPVTGLSPSTYYVDVIDGYGCVAEDIVAGSLFDAGQTFIPDGQGQSWSSIITLSGFNGATIQSADQIQSVCATLEHSKIGELEITLTSPNGTVVTLKEQPGGNNTNFGEPCAVGPTDAAQGGGGTDPGIGYNYCWQNISTYGTMVSESNNFTYTYINVCDGSVQSDKYLPAGSYQPYDPFSNFIGDNLDGDWTITVTDNIPNNNGYIFDWSISLQADPPDSIFTIYEPEGPTISNSVVNPDCGMSNGSIDVTISNGAPPLSYNWSNGEITEDLNNISAGTYILEITDDSACVYDYQVNLSNVGSLAITGLISNESCFSQNDGAIDITLSGTNPFTFNWNSGEITEDVTSLEPGIYTVEVIDGTGCEGIESFQVNAAPAINISSSITNELCGDGEGIINLTVIGAVEPISYSWSNGDNTQDIFELTQGEYIVQLTDDNGCFATDTFEVANLVGNCVPDCDLTITNQIVSDEICGQGNGFIDLTVFTTNGPYNVQWSNGEITSDISALSEGQYVVTITDIEGCEVLENFSISNQAGTLAINSIFVTNENCGNSQGGADASVSGGSQPYSYLWSNGATTQDLTGVSADDYTLTLTDDNGCSVSENVTILNNAGTLQQTYGNAVDEICGNSAGSIDIQISGGQFPYNYVWSNGATSQDLINLSAGNYSCIISDGSGCSITTPTYVVNNDAGTLNLDNIDIDNEICGNQLGDIELFVSGGISPITVVWNTGQNGNQLSNLSAGIYAAEITDDSGCSLQTGNLQVLNESGSLQLVNVSSFNELCGNSTGSINLEIMGGLNPISYSWSNGSSSPNINNLSSGNYTCIITDSQGCALEASAIITNDPGILNIDNLIITNETCGLGNGSLDLILSGAALPANYSWSNGSITEDLSNLNAGLYTVEITDNNGCTTAGSAEILNEANGMEINDLILINELCSGQNGSIELSISGGSAPLSYDWNNGENTASITGLTSGDYTCTITDNTGCNIQAGPYTINNSSGSFSLSLNSSTDESCNLSNGAIDINTTGGSGPITYSWNSGQITEDLSNISAGIYQLTATDNNGCIDVIEIELINNAGNLSLTAFQITDETCSNAGGSIDITIAGGNPGYTFLWSNGEITEDISGLPAGIYNVQVNDIAGCTYYSDDFIVNNNSSNFIVSGINIVDEVCGDGLGNVDLIVSGATGSVLYNWSNGSNTQDLNNVSAGSYSGYATDVAGCVITFSATVENDPGFMNVTGLIGDETCEGGNGSIDLTVNDATAPYIFVWSNGETTEDINGLVANSYTCNVTDDAGCFQTVSFSIEDLGGPVITGVASIDETCGNSDGEIAISVSGGTEPYVYTWNGSAPTSCCTYVLDMQDQGNSWNGASIDVFVDGNFTGNYTVPGGGANVGTFEVCNGNNIELFWNVGGFDNEVSFDLIDGQGNIVFSQGGNPGAGLIYAGLASCQGGDGSIASNLSAGSYSVVVTDDNGCADSVIVNIQNTSGNLQITDEVLSNETCSDNNGSIDLSVTGTGNVIASWSNGATTLDLSDIQAGIYTIDLIDQLGCSLSESYTIVNESNGLALSSFNLTEESCGDGTGSIDITMTGGIGPLSYEWDNGFTAEDISGLSAGEYTVTVFDGTQCNYDTTFVVVNNTGGFIVTATVTDSECDQSNGSIDLTITGAIGNISTVWNNGSTSEDLTNLSSGVYQCTITDDSGCIILQSYTIENNDGGLIVEAITNPDFCEDAQGFIDLTMIGGNGPFTYAWNNGQTTEDLTNLNSGFYSVVITDVNGCESQENYFVESDGFFNYSAAIVADTCSANVGSIELIILAGPQNFNWNNGETTPTISDLTSGWYVVELSSNFGPGGGCTMIDSFYVDNYQGGLAIDSLVVTNENCNLDNGAIESFISGGSLPYTYSWSSGQNSANISGLDEGSYSLLVIDNQGCTSFLETELMNVTFGFGISQAVINNEFCGDGNGSIDLEVVGGTAPYTYDWDNDGTGDLDDSQDLSLLSAGTYQINVFDALGCMVDNEFSILSTTGNFVVQSTVSNETCGNLNGAIDLTISGGVQPISINWSTGENSEDLVDLAGGVYNCTITDDAGCEILITETVEALSANFEIGNPILIDELCGNQNGSITLNPTGGEGPITYDWDLQNPCCSYTLNCYDLNNNGWGGNPLPIVIVYVNGSFYGNYAVPPGNGNSFFTVEIPVCTGDFIEFEYSEGQQNQNNVYEILDENGDVVFQDGPNPFNGIAFSSNVNCSNNSSNSLTGLIAGSYPVTIIDANGCELQDTFNIVNNESNFAVIDTLITNETCSQNNGSILLTLSGGTEPYYYSWNGSVDNCCTYTLNMSDQGNSWNGASIDVFIDGNFDGNYTVPGGGANIETFEVCSGELVELFWNPGGFDNEVSFVLLNGNGDPLFNQGGNPPNGLLFADFAVCSGGINPVELIGLSEGSFTINAVDNAGCSINETYEVINIVIPITVIGDSITNSSCPTCSDGSIDQNLEVGNYSYIWSNGETSEDISDLTSGSYSVIITNNAGCDTSITYMVGSDSIPLQPLDPFISLNPNPNDGVFTITYEGINGPLQLDFYDALGRVVYQMNQNELANSGSLYFDFSRFASGMYSVKASYDSGTWKKKFLVFR